MGGEQERLALVTRFSDLRAGDLVVVKPCGHCGKTHRGILGNRDDTTASVDPDGNVNFSSYEVLGVKHTSYRPEAGGRSVMWPVCISEWGVRRRIVYRVDTGLTHTTETEKELEVTR